MPGSMPQYRHSERCLWRPNRVHIRKCSGWSSVGTRLRRVLIQTSWAGCSVPEHVPSYGHQNTASHQPSTLFQKSFQSSSVASEIFLLILARRFACVSSSVLVKKLSMKSKSFLIVYIPVELWELHCRHNEHRLSTVQFLPLHAVHKVLFSICIVWPTYQL